MTSVMTAGPAVPPESARRVKAASGGADRVFGRPLRGTGLLVLLIMTTIGSQLIFVPPAFAQGFVPISGAGSTGSFNALDQWRRDVNNLYQIQVQFSPTGSSTGREDFKTGQVDFAVSEIEYGLTDGRLDAPPISRAFGYLPVVASGPAFMYNLKIGNNRVTNLRLSGEVIAKIFSKQITNWSDEAIKADNPGLNLPARPPQPPECDRKGGAAQCTTGTGGAQTPTPPSGPPTLTPGGPPMPPRGPPTSPPGGTSCLAAIHMLLANLPREVLATTTRTYQRYVPALLRCDSILKRVGETAASAPVRGTDR